jgi:transcriptional regulator with XRE-family HTH domain
MRGSPVKGPKLEAGSSSLRKKKGTNSTDAHVGQRMRLQRIALGMSQERLGELLGLTFQQIQKYEKGLSRVGAGRLFDVAALLRVPIGFFFENADASPRAGGFAKDEEPPPVVEFMASDEGLQLSVAFMRIKDAKVRRRVLNLVRQVADGDLW